MVRSELVSRVAKANPHLARRDIEIAVATFFGEIAEAVVRGDQVKLRRFGTFFLRRRVVRNGPEPSAGIGPRAQEEDLIFRPSTLVTDRINFRAKAATLYRF